MTTITEQDVVVVEEEEIHVVSVGEQGPAGAVASAPQFHAATEKTAIVDADEIPALDSENSYGLRKFTWGGIKARLKTYFDTLYSAVTHNHDSAYEAKNTNIQAHIGITAGNPHGTTAAQVGADPAGTAASAVFTHASGTGVHSIAGVFGLQTALDAKADLVEGKIPAAQLPSYVDDVVEAANFAALPVTGETGKVYVALDSNKTYRWSGSAYAEISASPGSTDAVTEGATNLYFTAARVRAVVLTGLSTATNAVISATDTVLSAFGKLQSQITAFISDTNTALGNKQDKDATLTAIAGVTTAADKFIYSTGPDAFSTTDLTAQARTLLAATDQSGQRTAIGLGTMSTQAANNVAITGGAIDGTPIGATTKAAGGFTTLTTTGAATLGDDTAADSHTVNGATTVSVNSASPALKITQAGSGSSLVVEDAASDTTPFVVDASGKLIVGYTSALFTGATFVVGVDDGSTRVHHVRYSADANTASLMFTKSRGASIGTNASVQSGDVLGQLIARGADGTSFVNATIISSEVDGTPGISDMPSRLVISVTADGASTPTEALRVSNTQAITHRSNSTTVIDASSHLGLRPYTVATLPSATAQRLIYVSDGTSNKRLAVSDGTNWRWPDGAIVS